MKSCEEMYNEVQSLIESKRKADAICALENLLESYPEFAPAHYELASLYYNKGDESKALEHYQESINLEPLNATYQKGLADFYYVALGNAGEAWKQYNKV